MAMRSSHDMRRRNGTAVTRALLALIASMALAVLGGTTATASGPMRTAVVVGSVLGINDDPVNGMDDPLAGATVQVIDAHSGKVLGASSTDRLGTFRVASVPVSKVKIRISKAGFLTVWSDNSATRAGATTYHLHPGRTLTLANEQVLYAEAVIEGQVLADFDPAGDPTRVEVFDAVTQRRLAAVDVPGGDARYRIGGLPARPVKVRAVPLAGLWMPAWADGAGSWDTARVFELYAGEHLVQSWDPVALYIDLAYAGEVTGTVVGGGRPIYASRVTVLDPSGVVIAEARTDRSGHYGVRFTDWGGLQVKVKATKRGWKPAYANGEDTFETADLIYVGPHQSVALPTLVLKH
jgi:hypothetical protein